MEKYISKSAIVKEIEKRLSIVLDPFNNNIYTKRLEETYNELLSFLNTLEVKEVDLEKRQEEDVDLEKEVNQYYEKTWPFEEVDEDIIAFARHFFELGLKAQSKDMIETLRTEYEKGRADVLEKVCEFLKSYRQDTPDGTGYIAGIVNDKTIEELKKVIEIT